MNNKNQIETYLEHLSAHENNLLSDLLKKMDICCSNISSTKKILAYDDKLDEAIQKVNSADFFTYDML